MVIATRLHSIKFVEIWDNRMGNYRQTGLDIVLNKTQNYAPQPLQTRNQQRGSDDLLKIGSFVPMLHFPSKVATLNTMICIHLFELKKTLITFPNSFVPQLFLKLTEDFFAVKGMLNASFSNLLPLPGG